MDDEECKSEVTLKLPGFRFHPTEEELLNFYPKNMVLGKKYGGDVIGVAKTGEKEWYFLVGREGGRSARRRRGSDRQIVDGGGAEEDTGILRGESATWQEDQLKATPLKVLEQRANAIIVDESSRPLVLPNGNIRDLHLPKMTMDWMQDSFSTNLSPWLHNFTPFYVSDT